MRDVVHGKLLLNPILGKAEARVHDAGVQDQ
jgi:hypothetical protein